MTQPKPTEDVTAVVVDQDGRMVSATVTPTQVRRPWRATVRTVVWTAVAVASLVPFIVTGIYQGNDALPAVIVQLLSVSGAVTRVAALPQVEAFLQAHAAWLAAAPAARELAAA